MTDFPDVLDVAAGLSESSPVTALRREREEVLRLSESNHRVALQPRSEGSFPRAERAALCARMARLFKDGRLAGHYAGLLADERPGPTVLALSDPQNEPPADPRLAAVVRHVDLVSLTPEAATPGDIEKLKAAGLDDASIVTLAGLIALVNYQIRVAAGLRMLEGLA